MPEVAHRRLSFEIYAAENYIPIVENAEVVPHAKAISCPGIPHFTLIKGISPVFQHIGLKKHIRIDLHHIPLIYGKTPYALHGQFPLLPPDREHVVDTTGPIAKSIMQLFCGRDNPDRTHFFLNSLLRKPCIQKTEFEYSARPSRLVGMK